LIQRAAPHLSAPGRSRAVVIGTIANSVVAKSIEVADADAVVLRGVALQVVYLKCKL
jgi:hypothetical protein